MKKKQKRNHLEKIFDRWFRQTLQTVTNSDGKIAVGTLTYEFNRRPYSRKPLTND